MADGRQYEPALVQPRPAWWLHVRFEQARGRGGVPKVSFEYQEAQPSWQQRVYPEVDTLVRMAVDLLRAMCADPGVGHGEDLVPPGYGKYALHNVDGGVIVRASDIRWRTGLQGADQHAELVLVWGSPAALLQAAVGGPHAA